MFLNAMYGGLGQSLGAIIGGKLQSRFGTVRAFIYSGLFDLAFVALVVVYLAWRGSSGFRDPRPMGEEEDIGVAVPESGTKIVAAGSRGLAGKVKSR